MTTTEKIAALLSLTKRLTGMLEDPHPGLSTWHNAVGSLLTEIAEQAPPSRKAFAEARAAMRAATTTQPGTKCDADLYENGRTVCLLHGCSTAIEAVVVRVRESLGVPLDWHFIGGRANVLTAAATPPEMDAKIREHINAALPVWLGA